MTHYYIDEKEKIKELAQNDRKFELTVVSYYLMKERLHEIFKKSKKERAGVILGIGADTTLFTLIEQFLEQSNDEKLEEYLNEISEISELSLNKYFNAYDISSIFLAEKLQLAAFQKSLLTACTSSTQAIGFAFNSIQNNEADIVLAGGTDSIVNLPAFISFDKLGALAPQSEILGETCKPFDNSRQGTLASEAAGLCVLASESFVKEHDLSPKFELLGFGNTLDAYKITAPDPTGKGMKRAVKQAIDSAKISNNDIDYINTHGTGTNLNDQAEANAFIDVFGDDLQKIPFSSTKDRHGHAIAAAGIQEFAVLCASMEQNLIPHTINLKNPIPKEGFNPVKDKNIEKEINVGMSCNYAFGGVNSVLIIKKIND
ncbi:MAG: beta-ketoacyl-[acyl-carrier-protein] synthase family protein [Bacteroidota bacterium]|nr:beta-ketoacyl-[acyl-carrier-protein] synthase family protein [Bacteroidota bacterium]